MARDEYGLTPKQRAFADEYIANKGNATQAYKKAYTNVTKDETARVNGSRMLTNANVSEYIANVTKDALEERKYTAQDVIKSIWSISMGEVQKGYSKQYDHLEGKTVKEMSYEFTPTIEERQRSIEFVSKLLKLDEHDELKVALVKAQIEKIRGDKSDADERIVFVEPDELMKQYMEGNSHEYENMDK